MKRRMKLRSILTNQQGATAIIVGLMLIVLVGFLALAIDVGYVYVAQNELQNAADAGALAGARFLINPDGTINTNANQIGHDAATSNESTNIPVEVNWSGGNIGDVQRGHWSFATRTFTPNDSTTQTSLWFRTKEDLDADLNFINAVRVVTRRESQPVNMFLAGIFGHDTMVVVTDAVAYIGFAGNMSVSEVDQPIAICAQSLTDEYGTPNCDVGRMINSGDNLDTYQTGGWTSFDQESPCTGGTNANEVKSLVCNTSNSTLSLKVGQNMATQGGQIQSAFTELYNCWQQKMQGGYEPWTLKLPVVRCTDHNNITVCEPVVGAVTVEVVWITGPGEDPDYVNAPTEMGAWSNYSSDGYERWVDFSNAFNLENLDGTSPVPYAKKNIYFKPDCEPSVPTGGTGGENFGMLAQIPVLVE
ncbi:MAG: pilus assembly protein TadG-related protein [Syntrophobacteria bacterium]